jgi:hypothetical protein
MVEERIRGLIAEVRSYTADLPTTREISTAGLPLDTIRFGVRGRVNLSMLPEIGWRVRRKIVNGRTDLWRWKTVDPLTGIRVRGTLYSKFGRTDSFCKRIEFSAPKVINGDNRILLADVEELKALIVSFTSRIPAIWRTPIENWQIERLDLPFHFNVPYELFRSAMIYVRHRRVRKHPKVDSHEFRWGRALSRIKSLSCHAYDPEIRKNEESIGRCRVEFRLRKRVLRDYLSPAEFGQLSNERLFEIYRMLFSQFVFRRKQKLKSNLASLCDRYYSDRMYSSGYKTFLRSEIGITLIQETDFDHWLLNHFNA